MQRNLSDTYQIIGIIGSGGCGDVYKAYHKKSQEICCSEKNPHRSQKSHEQPEGSR